MKKNFRIIAGIVLLAIVSAGVWWFMRSNEPVYQGKTLTQWIRGLEYENVNPTDEQRDALRAMGEPAITRLIEILKSHDPPWKREFVAYAWWHPDVYNRFIARRVVVPEETYHVEAATALGEIGPSARSGIPALMAVSTNESRYISATRAKAALMKIRQEPIEPLLTALANTRSTNWLQAALTTKYLGTNAEAAVPLLVEALQSTNAGVRQSAVMALGGIARHSDIAVPALIGCLHDTSAGVRRGAVDALCEFKDARQQIVPLFLTMLQDTDNNVWLGAAFGVEKIVNADEKKKLYVPALVKSLNSSTPAIRANAGIFLKRADPEAAAKAGIRN